MFPKTTTLLLKLIEILIQESLVDLDSYLLFVDDGSNDNTWKLIEGITGGTDHCKGLKLSRNFGHQNALLAGLSYASDADMVVSIDADLQDDPEAIREMIIRYKAGSEIVYGIRDGRQTDSWFKRNSALFFYKLLSFLGVETVYNHADYRLMSRKALDAFLEFGEANTYIRGLIPLVGFRSDSVHYTRSRRIAGKSKYTFRKMLSLAWNGVSGLSVRPLRFVTVCGFIVFIISILLSVYAIYSYCFLQTTPGWASTVLPMYFLGGLQLLCIGLIGEYIAKIYKEVKRRPRFIIDKYTG